MARYDQDPAILDRIKASLREIEERDQVRILYAVESGSRAWGFPSANSDYDARFLYVQRPDWYLSINADAKRDVIERPITDLLDINGWDLRKALGLFVKSNPPLLEWLRSPIVYRDQLGLAAQLRSLLPQYHSPISSAHHYLQMAKGNHREYLKGETVRLKKYFYVIRPMLAVLWIEQGRGPAPTEFEALLTLIADRTELMAAIRDLLDRKKAGDELDQGAAIPVIDRFLNDEIERLADFQAPARPSPLDLRPLNLVFQNALRQAWPDCRLEWS